MPGTALIPFARTRPLPVAHLQLIIWTPEEDASRAQHVAMYARHSSALSRAQAQARMGRLADLRA